MSLNYTTYVAQISNLMVQVSSDPNFMTMLPGMIDYAEQRMYRELDLQASRVSDATTTVSSGSRIFNYPTDKGVFIVVEQMNIWTPSSATSSNAHRHPLTMVSKEFMDLAWPSASSNNGIPLFFAPFNNTTCLLGPAPDQSYPIEVNGTQRPTPLSSGNSSTWLTMYLPDVFIAASMIFATAYQRDFGAMANNPQQGTTWESEYQTLKNSANSEELRKRFMSEGWQPMTPSPIATPKRV
jgi:hypothetical protein